MKTKPDLRKHYRGIRENISPKRRELAAQNLLRYALPIAMQGRYALSFVSRDTEIDTHLFNRSLAEVGKLVLPRVCGRELHLFLVTDLNDLEEGTFGILEPKADRCERVDTVDVVFVPGLAFDQEGYRLGYGHGFYDRALKGLEAKTYGLCFTEQVDPAPLPRERHDLPLDEVLSF